MDKLADYARIVILLQRCRTFVHSEQSKMPSSDTYGRQAGKEILVEIESVLTGEHPGIIRHRLWPHEYRDPRPQHQEATRDH